MESRTYRVPESNLAKLTGQIEKLNKRAVKLAVSPIILNTLDHEDVPEMIDGMATGKVYRFYSIQFTGATPKLAGWEFWATIQHLGTDGNILRSVPGIELPESYRSASPLCEHCQTERMRSETFIVRHESGQLKQVGRNCIADFLGGANPETYLANAELLLRAAECGELAEDSEDYRGPRLASRVELKHFVELCAVMIREHGFTSRSKAREDANAYPTANRVQTWMAEKDKTAEDKARYAVQESDSKLASDAIIWAQGLTGSSDYEYNLSIIAKLDAIEFKMAGLAASIIPAFCKANEIETRKRLAVKQFENSRYFGTVGEREVFTLTVVAVIALESQYGVTHLHKMIDANGNLAIWFSTSQALDVKNTYALKSTVKKHEDYKGIQQTILTRCAVQSV